jgi:Uma2 family endonuclease
MNERWPVSAVATLDPAECPPVERLLTIADVAALPSELPSGAVRYELDDRRLIIMAPAGDIHGRREARIVYELVRQGEIPGYGTVRCGEAGIILRRDPDRLVGADASFVTNARLPIRMSPEGYLETIPDLVTEVRSKNDRPTEVADKVAEYLAAGVRLVWVLDPQQQTVTAHRPGQPPRVFTAGETLTADDIIPGFAAAVAELFHG